MRMASILALSSSSVSFVRGLAPDRSRAAGSVRVTAGAAAAVEPVSVAIVVVVVVSETVVAMLVVASLAIVGVVLVAVASVAAVSVASVPVASVLAASVPKTAVPVAVAATGCFRTDGVGVAVAAGGGCCR